MNNDTTQITIVALVLSSIPLILALFILFQKKIKISHNIYAFIRMVAQLVFIGYILNYIFATKRSIVVLAILILMLLISSTISLGTWNRKKLQMLPFAFAAIFVGAGLTISYLTQIILHISPWYNPRSLIPLAGMILFNSLNAISLAFERYQNDISNEIKPSEAEKIAIRVSIIPITNSFFAAGIVSLPGLMTGQILSGISPLIAVRYQIIILCMVFSAQVFSVFIFLSFISRFPRVFSK